MATDAPPTCPQCGEVLLEVELPKQQTLRRYANQGREDLLEMWALTPPLYSPSCSRAYWPWELEEATAGRWDRRGTLRPARNDHERSRERLNRLVNNQDNREKIRGQLAKADRTRVRDVMEVISADDK